MYTQNDRRHDFWIITEPQYTLLYTLDEKHMIKIVPTLYKRMCQENIRCTSKSLRQIPLAQEFYDFLNASIYSTLCVPDYGELGGELLNRGE